jgi:ribokinase
MRIAVVGHVEWTEFAPVPRVPEPGQIVEVARTWQRPAGGGAVAAVQIARLGGECLFLTALADDELGRRAKDELEAMGLSVAVAWRPGSQRRAFVYLDADGERTITTIGARMGPAAADPLPWGELAAMEAIYVTAADVGALRAARAADKLVATVRVGDPLTRAGALIDVLVLSAGDSGERYRPGSIEPAPAAVVRSSGSSGGEVELADGETRRWKAAPLPGPRVDVHGAGDCFAGALTYGLGRGWSIDKALKLAAECGAAALTRRGPYGEACTA